MSFVRLPHSFVQLPYSPGGGVDPKVVRRSAPRRFSGGASSGREDRFDPNRVDRRAMMCRRTLLRDGARRVKDGRGGRAPAAGALHDSNERQDGRRHGWLRRSNHRGQAGCADRPLFFMTWVCRRTALAEGVGFEPTIRFPVYTLSRRAPSTARPPLRLALRWRRAKARRIAPGARPAQAEAHGGFAGEQPQAARKKTHISPA